MKKWLTLLLWSTAIGRLVMITASFRSRWLHWDFTWYYLPALVLRRGIDPYTTDLRPLAQRLGFDTDMVVAHDTPTLLLTFEPLSRFNVETAYWIWIAIKLLAFAFALVLLLREVSFGTAMTLAAAAIIYEPVSLELFLSQTQLLILCLLAVTLWSLENGRERSAGLLLALSALLGAYPLVMAGYLVMRRRWLTLLYLVLGLAIGGFATLLLVPPSLHWVTAVLVFGDAGFRSSYTNVSLSATVWRLLTLDGSHVWRGVEIPIVLVELGLLAVSLRATRSADGERGFGLWVVTAILLSPVAWIHYMVLLLVPFSQIASAAMRGRLNPRITRMTLASYLLITFLPLAQLLTRSAALGECAFLSLAAVYLSAYWFATEQIVSPKDH
jgi:hypothetical protein